MRFRRQSGFTLIELIVVITVITIVLGLAFPVYGAIQEYGRRSLTRSTVQAVVTAMASYQLKAWPIGTRVAPLWDVNRDGLVDGDPSLENGATPGVFAVDVVTSAYGGLVLMTGVPLPRRCVDERQRVVDAWDRPLRIVTADDVRFDVAVPHVSLADASKRAAVADRLRVAGGIGVWSAGRDGIDAPLDQPGSDDLRTWERP